ncbi:MAG: phospholipase D-like domain-containing protein [Chloroflexi bacterium]|nr:phospholipase D-like domain-containing protein [Chloroflexota bacterium]
MKFSLTLAIVALVAPPALAVQDVSDDAFTIDQVSDGIALIVEKPGSCDRHSMECSTLSCETLIGAIRSAEHSIEFAVYGMRGVEHILEALLRAKDRGVNVRGIVDEQKDGEYTYIDTGSWKDKLQSVRTDGDAERRLSKKLIRYQRPSCPTPEIRSASSEEVIRFEGPRQCVAYETEPFRWRVATHASRMKLSNRTRIMHHKFFIFDRSAVWTGSANVSDTGIGGCNANVVLYLQSKEVAERYIDEFKAMWGGHFHEEKRVPRTSAEDRAEESMQISQHKLRVAFSPQDRPVSAIKRALGQATKTINVGMFFLTHRDLACSLVAAQNRGVVVRVIVDATGAGNEYTKHRILRDAGIAVKVEDWAAKMHMKAASIDGQTLIAGSMNWTSAGERVNDENTLIIRSTTLAYEFDEIFEALWRSIPDRWKQDRPDPESGESIGSCEDGRDNDFDEKIDAQDPGCGQTPPALPPLPPEWNANEPPDGYWQCAMYTKPRLKEWSPYDDNRNGRVSCAEAERHGITPVKRGDPAYPWMRDADADGLVCE